MGNSIITLGAYGGLKDKYKYIGNHHDNFGFRNIYKQEWLSLDDNKAWLLYLERHPKTKLTKSRFFKQRKRQKNQHANKTHKRKKHRLSPTVAKRQSDLAYAQKEVSLQKNSSKVAIPNHIKKQRKMKSAHQRWQNDKNFKKKQYAVKFKEAVRSNPFFAKKYFYQKKNTVQIGDILEFEKPHTCKRNSQFKVALFKDGTITIVCTQCFARYRLTYKQLLLLQYNAKNFPASYLRES